MDDVAGIIRIIKQALPTFVDSGKVASISAGRAMVYIGSEANQQPCSYDPSSGVQAGDTVVVMKAPRLSLWTIVAVTFRKNAGLANTMRETPNNRAGAPRFATVSVNGNGSDSITAASGQLLVTVPMTFNGGRAMVMHNGSATIASGASVLTLGVGIDSGSSTVFSGSIATVTTPVNFSYVSATPLYGPHTILLYAGRSSANVSLSNYQFIVAEI